MIEAVKHGAHVYCQKPISVDVAEGQAMLAAARKHNRVVQVGTQRRSTPHLQQAIEEVIKPGKLGEIGHVELCCYYAMRGHERLPVSEPPPHFDYEMWTGPAPMRPYMANVHPKNWRHFQAYGNGIMGDMCIHMLDMVRWMLDLGWPKRIYSTGGIYVDTQSAADIPDTQTATFEFPEYDVVWNHRTWGTSPDPEYPWAAFIYGEKGTLKASVAKWEFIPKGDGEKMRRDVLDERDKFPQDEREKDLDAMTAPANRRHQQDFLAAIAEGGRPVADIEQGYISSASCILANLSMELGRTLQWDSQTGKVVGDDQANARLAREYREPWLHPASQT
jgi:predicted dehydrogenase